MQVKPTNKGQSLNTLATFLEYPRSDYFESLELASTGLTELRYKQASKTLEEFKKNINEFCLDELEELYTRTFDVAPVCSPYISVHIYGDENFDRGNLMATLQTKFDERGFSRSDNELPDHLAVLLKFCHYLTQEELDELIEFCLKEPVERMAESLKGSKKPNPYYYPLKAVLEILKV